nr:hypothetical protein CFP56_33193 [Quercus suber]
MASRLRFPISRSQLKHSQNRINESHVLHSLLHLQLLIPLSPFLALEEACSRRWWLRWCWNIKSRLLVQDPEKAISFFGKQDEETLQVIKGILGTQRILIHLSLRE